MIRIRTVLVALAGLVALSACAEPDPEDFGAISIELQKRAGEDPFLGTSSVTVQVAYEQDCLEPFYLESDADYQIDGVAGAEIFQDWEENNRACSSSREKVADCTVVGYDQFEAQESFKLEIEFDVHDADLEGKRFYVGPLPTEELTGDCRPTVRLNQSGIQGHDEDGPIWQVETLPAPNTAVTDQGAPLRVIIRPN